ncbi:MAG: tetratricopeptide repeat protein [Nannocystaceae bacterium]
MAELLAAIERALRRRRFRALLYGATALALAAIAAVALQRLRGDARAQACASEGDALDRSLRLSGAPRIARAFAATGQVGAADTFLRTIPWLRRHAAAWGVARRDLCLEIAEAGRATPIQERGLACLVDRQAAFEVLVDGVFARADANALRVAIHAAAGLAPISACVDPKVLAATPELPDDPVRRAVVASLRERLQRAQILLRATRYDQARPALEAIVEEARAAGWTPLVLAAQTHLGSLAHLQARYDEARALLEAVVWEAEATGDDVRVAAAASALVDVANHGQGQLEEAFRWSRLAMAALRRVGLDDDLPASDVLGSAALLHETRGDLEAALAAKEAMLAIRIRVLGRDHPSVAATHNMLGVTYLLRDDPEASRRHHARALAIRTAALGAGHLEVAISRLNLAEVYLKTGDLEPAIELSEQARDVLSAHFGADHPFTVAAVHNLAWARLRGGDAAGALALHREVLAARERAFGPSHPEVAESRVGIAEAERRLGDDVEAEAELRRALAIYESTTGRESVWVAGILRRLGDLLLDRGDVDGALAALERAASIVEPLTTSAEVRGPLRFALGRALWERGDDRARARAAIDEGAALARSARTLDPAEVAAIDRWIADNLSEGTGSSIAEADGPPGTPGP